jgi:hypothetical protein
MSKAGELKEALRRRFNAPDERAALRRACASLLAETGQLKPPVKLKAVLNRMAVTYNYDTKALGKEEAALLFGDNGLELHISRARFQSSPARARFTIAHEIGHAILLRALGNDALELGEADPEAYQTVERLCDFAASHLLMPREQLGLALRERGLGRDAVRELMALFEVSKSALFKAIAELHPDGAVIEWRRYRRNPTEPLCWRVWSTYASAVGDPPWLPKGCTLKHLGIEPYLEKLKPDTPQLVRKLRLSLGRVNRLQDAVLCRWSATSRRQHALLEKDEGSLAPRTRISQDCVLVVLSRPDRLDGALFGAKD